ncbi:MAG: adenylyltransferase/cytidyltransferase family protein [Dinghuibacter sp.]|nr:adenylyltransferase/cytidyltransferase family protein [Dinghuibacter sp.]
MKKKIMVTGVFDMLHSGHVAFLQNASLLGDLYVCIGNDENVLQLKQRGNIQPQEERRFMIAALRCVYECRVNRGMGLLDFIAELEAIRPDIFVVNEDGHSEEKKQCCARYGIEYRVLKRLPHEGLPARSTTAIRETSDIPFRLDLAGGWLDQPFVSQHFPGAVLTICIEPEHAFNMRSGMSSSTRNKAIELWQQKIPGGNREQLAKILFAYENPPGTKEVAGSQDALGIVMPGLNRYDYNGAYWPEKIQSVHDESILSWLEQRLYLAELGPREAGYSVLADTDINATKARALAVATDLCWGALLQKDAVAFGRQFTASFNAQVSMFPHMSNAAVETLINQYRQKALGWKLSGAGGGGYLVLFSETTIDDALRIRIRRKD